jgi:hypothetical protein
MTGPVSMNNLKSKELIVDGKATIVSLKTDTLTAGEAKIIGLARMTSANVDTDITCKELRVLNNANFSKLYAASGKIVESLTVDGTLSVRGSFLSNGDCFINATISSQRIRVDQLLTTHNLTVSNILKADAIRSEGDIETSKGLIADKLLVKRQGTFSSLVADVVNVSTSMECQQLRCIGIQSSSMKVMEAVVENDFHVGGQIFSGTAVHTGAIRATNATLSGNLRYDVV